MEEMARTMGHYANKLEQLKREKSMITVTYEVRRYCCIIFLFKDFFYKKKYSVIDVNCF